MRYLTFIIVLLFLAGPMSHGQDPAYDANYEKLVKEYTLHADGSYDYREMKQLRLNTHFAFHRLFGETFIIYNPEYQELNINESYTIMADGRKVETPENAFNELLPRAASEAPAYNQLREMAVTHTGLEVGAVIHLDYSVKSTKDFMPFFMGMEEIRHNVPVDEMEIVVRVPEDISLKYRVLNIRTAPDIFTENGRMVYRWSFRNVQPHAGEKYTPEEGDPVLFFSIMDLQRAFFTFVNQDAFRYQLPEAVREKSAELGKKEMDEIERVMEAQEWLLGRMTHKEIPMRYSGFRIRPPAEVWESTYGNSLELGILLSGMLLEAGINAYPVACMPAQWFHQQVGNMEMFEEYLVQVNPKKHGRIYLNPVSVPGQNLLYSMAGKTCIQLDAAIESVRTFEEKEYQSKMKLEGTVRVTDSAFLAGNLELEVNNAFHPYYKVLQDSANAGKLVTVKFKSDDIAIDKLTEAELNATMSFEDKTMSRKVEDFLMARLPKFTGGVDTWELGALPAERTEMLELPYPVDESYKLVIEMPGEWEPVGNPLDLEKKTGFGSASLKVTPGENRLMVERHIKLEKRTFTPAEYMELIEMVKIWDMLRGREMILKSTGTSD